MNDLNDLLFEKFRKLIFEESGINLNSEKKELVRTRLLRRLQKCEIPSYKEYYDYVIKDSAEMVHMLDAISTNLTSFFREPKHFQFLNNKLLPELINETRKKDSRRIRVWSAGSSTGEEPYSLMMTVLEHIENALVWDIKLLATDISTEVLGKAKKGVYASDRMKTIPQNLTRKYFQKGCGKNNGLMKVKENVKKLIHFNRINLMDNTYPFSGLFDFIFCRNVMIYFDRKTQEELINKFYSHLQKGGYLFIGHSESLTGVTHPFSYIQPTIYRKR